MKKLSRRRKAWLLRKARNLPRGKSRRRRHKQHFVTLWQGSESERVIAKEGAVPMPAILCFDTNPDETVRCLCEVIESIAPKSLLDRGRSRVWVTRPRRKPAWIKRYFDYSLIDEISTAASVVVAAEYDRAQRIIGAPPPTVNLECWNKGAFDKLYAMGFFEIVGLSADVSDRFNQSGDVKTMRIVSGQDAGALEEACVAIWSLSEFIGNGESALSVENQLALNTAISEALSNVTRWAYPTDTILKYKPVNRWWIGATADRANRTLTVVVYDQGASIPVMFPRLSRAQRVKEVVAALFRSSPSHPFAHDGLYIAEAMKPGNTTTDARWHGKGLPQMVETIDLFRGGSLTILSRGGECRYVYGKGSAHQSRRHAVSGTLIEWNLIIP